MRILTILFEFDLIAVHAFNFLRDVALCSLCLPDSISVICILTLTKATYLIITALYTLYTNVLVLQILIQTKLTEMCGNNIRSLRTVTEGEVIKRFNEFKDLGNWIRKSNKNHKSE